MSADLKPNIHSVFNLPGGKLQVSVKLRMTGENDSEEILTQGK